LSFTILSFSFEILKIITVNWFKGFLLFFDAIAFSPRVEIFQEFSFFKSEIGKITAIAISVFRN